MKNGQTTLFQTWGYFEKQKDQKQDINDQELCDTFKDDIDIDENLLGEKSFLDDKFQKLTSPETITGFDISTGSNYVYPTNYPIREYQFRIIKKALLKNTLVVLPTGLGKTFIAAVVMYNYYRWYPSGKIIFMAPTKPLVAQQIEACYKIIGIPQEDTAEMTGTMQPMKRLTLWQNKRVFFLTPQILQNDLAKGTCSGTDVVCLVFDEAHKAQGNHAYCQVVKDIKKVNPQFRILALSATPGGDMKAVQKVVDNLLISHVEIRSDESADIKRYIRDRLVEKIVVPITEELKNIKNTFMEILRSIVNRLYSKKALWQNDPEKISKFLLLKAREQWRLNNALGDKNKMGLIEGDFALCMSLYHAYELLQQHGILSFYNFLKGILSGVKGTSRSKVELSKNNHFMKMMEELSVKIEPDVANLSFSESFLGIKQLTTKQRLLKTIPKPKDGFYSHPKLKKLEEIVIDHFTKAQRENEANNIKSQTCLNTRVMIFSQYRDSVQEITALLNKHEPLVRVMSFIGQGSKEGIKGKNTKGLSQKEQIEILERFRQGGFNTVVSTSVGEEGLDIGDVDLIVCYDASNSPIRLVQRMGRTGRKRNGRIVILVGEGKEEATYKRSQSNKKGIHSQLLSAAKSLQLYTEDCRMIPKHINPTCIKTFIDVCAYRKDEKKTKKGCTKTTKSKADKKEVSCEECERLQTEKCEVHATKTRKRAEKKTENFKKPKVTKKAGKNKENKLNSGEIWRKHYTESLRHDVAANEDNSDEEFDSFFDNQLKTDIQQKLKNDIFGSKNDIADEQLKPCPLEVLLEKVESDIKKNKKKVRVTKLPKRLSKEAEHIEDNQLGFCSQVSMDTLYNRCQERRKSQLESLLQITEEDCEANGEQDIEVNGTEEINDGGDLNAVQGLSGLLSITSPVQTDKIESAKVFGENAANEVNDSDELKASQGLSRFLPMTSPVQTSKLESTKKVCVVTPFVPESVPEAPIDIDLSSFLLDPTDEDLIVKSPKLKENQDNNVVPLVESKYTCVKEKDNIISINDDLLFSDDGEEEDDEEMSSPPVVSQLMQSKRVTEDTNTARKINLNDIFSNCSETENVENNESPIKRKKVSKKTLRIEDDSIPLAGIDTSEPFNYEEESPLFRKPKRNRRRVLESQTTPIHATVNDKKRNESGGTKRKWSNNLNVKTTQLKGNLHARMYIDDEAEDDCDESHHENEVTIGGYLLDSFIDDASQVTPAPRKKRRTKRDSADTPDMDVIYKQSLMSPKFSLLNFRTPAFKMNRNRYKMVEKCNYASDESSEAEEVNGLVESEENLSAEEENTSCHDDSTKPEKHSNNRPTIMKNVGQNRCGRVRPFKDSDDEDFLQPNVSLNKRRHSPADENGAIKSDDSLKVTFDCRPWCKTFSADDITVVTFSFDIPWVESPEKGRVNTRYTVDSPPHVVIVDSEHAKDSQIPSLLRTNHQCHVICHSQVGSHYAVSLRCGIVKTKLSDISNKLELTRLKEALSTLTQLYKKPCLIIEKDCDKKMIPSKNYFVKKFSHLNVIHSADEINTTKLIFKLLNEELSVGCTISHLRKPHPDQMIASLLQISSMTYPIALEISNQFRDIYDLRKKSYDELKGKLPNVSSQIVANLFRYIREKC